VIRLWNRVGLYRTLAVLLLVGTVAGGIAVAADRPTQRPKAATAAPDAGAIDPAALERQDAERAEAERAARSDAQRKADEAAAAAAEQAKAKPSAKPSGSTKPGTTTPGVTIPADCNSYTGNRAIGCAKVRAAGMGMEQMVCLDKLWKKESGWNHKARNPGSGAFGIPQALPESKLGDESQGGADDYRTNPGTQINWGLRYIKNRYGSPCGAWAHSQNTGWY
jgi:heat shock protein HslJ